MECDDLTTSQSDVHNSAPQNSFNIELSVTGESVENNLQNVQLDIIQTSANETDSSNHIRQQTIHVEIRVHCFSVAFREVISQQVEAYLRQKGICNIPLIIDTFDDAIPGKYLIENVNLAEFLKDNIAALILLSEDADSSVTSDVGSAIDLKLAVYVMHVYRLIAGDEADPTYETIEVSSEVIKGGTRWLLPSATFDGLWDSLVFDSSVKRDLLNYSQSALLFADCKVSQNIISWNRVIFLHGPPGTGKTSLCQALAQKLAIRLSHRFSSAALIEINTVNLMSKWFSESARLVSQMFSSIFEYLEEPDHLVCLLVDEVESLTAVRKSVAAACEPSDAIRVVNAVLTHLDQLKHKPNVLVMATSNVTGVLDPAFLDRADICVYIGPPSPVAIYSIYCSCLNELIRVGLVERQKRSFVSYRCLVAFQFVENQVTAASLAVWKLSQLSVGLNGRTLRKLPLLAHAFHLKPAGAIASTNSPFVNLYTAKNNSTKNDNSSSGCFNNKRANCCSLPLFLDALQRAVNAKFSENSCLKEQLSESVSGNRVKLVSNKTAQVKNSVESNGDAQSFIRVL